MILSVSRNYNITALLLGNTKNIVLSTPKLDLWESFFLLNTGPEHKFNCFQVLGVKVFYSNVKK